MSEEKKDYILETYGDHEVTEFANTPVPTFLKFVYLLLPLWGIFWWVQYWDGSAGFLDRGYWKELQVQARTTRATKENQIQPKKEGNPSYTVQLED